MYLNVLQYSGKIHAAVPNAYGVCIARFIAIPLWILYEMNTSPVISAPLTLKTAQHAFAVLLHFILFPQSSSQSYESSRSWHLKQDVQWCTMYVCLRILPSSQRGQPRWQECQHHSTQRPLPGAGRLEYTLWCSACMISIRLILRHCDLRMYLLCRLCRAYEWYIVSCYVHIYCKLFMQTAPRQSNGTPLSAGKVH